MSRKRYNNPLRIYSRHGRKIFSYTGNQNTLFFNFILKTCIDTFCDPGVNDVYNFFFFT